MGDGDPVVQLPSIPLSDLPGLIRQRGSPDAYRATEIQLRLPLNKRPGNKQAPRCDDTRAGEPGG
jgi:hypothetical protein